MNLKKNFICLLWLSLISFPLVSNAQDHRTRWGFSDYYPKNYFFNDNDEDDQEYNDCIGEAVFYMRKAGVKPLRDLNLEKTDTILRLNYFPKFAHPLFIQVTNHNGHAFLTWQKGNAIRGHVEHTTYLALSDSGWVDETEDEYYGNDWQAGLLDSNARQLLPNEWSKIRTFLEDNYFIHASRAQRCTGFETPYLLEYRDPKDQNTRYVECYYDHGQELDLVKWLISLVDPDYVDMDIRYANDREFFTKPQFPGGADSMLHFLQQTVRYPEEALRHLEQYLARLELVVEKDGAISMVHDDSYASDNYGFVEEAIRAVKTMPRWTPATYKGKNVRCYANVLYNYVLPDSLRPHYGNPILETRRDSTRWKIIEEYHRKLLTNPQDLKAMMWMGKNYYWDFVWEHESIAKPTQLDSIRYEDRWDEFYDRTPVVVNPGDSALSYFYKVWQMNPDTNTLLVLYMPILQLEYCLQKTHNPAVKLPYDTVPGAYFPYSYFVNWPEKDVWDVGTDYILSENQLGLWGSCFWVNFVSKELAAMKEPVLYDYKLQSDEEIFRCSFFPSFHPSVSFRITKTGPKTTLYWEKLIPHYKEKADDIYGYETSYSLKKGKRTVKPSQYEEFVQLIKNVEQAELPRSFFVSMTDGAQWIYEHKTNQGFQAHLTNCMPRSLRKVFLWLVNMSKLDVSYAEDYL